MTGPLRSVSRTIDRNLKIRTPSEAAGSLLPEEDRTGRLELDDRRDDRDRKQGDQQQHEPAARSIHRFTASPVVCLMSAAPGRSPPPSGVRLAAPVTRAGIPATVTPAATSSRTAAPAPITLQSPTETPWMTFAPIPTKHPCRRLTLPARCAPGPTPVNEPTTVSWLTVAATFSDT